ncbi:MAG: hypothetical protein M3Z01_03685 [Thermoproteota archaeon]|nr:hypothetical protein [Thermoproteota archaeon]
MDKSKESSLNYKRGIYLSIFSGLSLLFVFYMYSRDSSPGNVIFINHSLYFFAVVVLFVFFVCTSFILIGVKRAFFSKKYYDTNPSKLIYYVQSSLKSSNYRIFFILITMVYFVFFGFLSNFFVFFNNDGTVFSVFPNQQHDNMKMTNNDSMKMTNTYYPKYNLIICCNSIGYVPMLILSINSSFSFLLIPLNFILGMIVSFLVGFNITINIYLLKQLKSMKLSKRSFFSFLGMSSGLFVGCPTCAGSFFYSLAGFSSLITFSYLSIYQIIFIIISIPLLILSVVVMAKLLQKKYLDSCKIK